MIFSTITAVGLHLATWHTEPGLNDANPGIYLRDASGWTAGAYYNSQRRTSVYFGKTWQAGPWALTAGGVTGYRAAPVLPLLIPSAKLGPLRLALIPPIKRRAAGGIHLSIEKEWK